MRHRSIIKVILKLLLFTSVSAQMAQPAPRSGYWDVCGPSNLYSTDYQICCGDKIYQNLRGDIDCCSGVAYNRTVNYCYNNNEIRPVMSSLPQPNPAPSVFFGSLPVQPQRVQAPAANPVIVSPVISSVPGVSQVVNPALINPSQLMPNVPNVITVPATAPVAAGVNTKPTSGYRCGSAALDPNVATTKTTLCCGNVAFDARFQLCSDFGPAPIQAAGIQGALTVSSPEKYYTCGLDQVPSSAVTSYDTAFCCGTVVYDSRFYTCTRNNAVVPQVPFSQVPGVQVQPQPQMPPVDNRPRPSAYPPVSDGFTRVRCLSNLFDVPTNHMTYYSCCGSQAFDERYFVCTSTGTGTPRAQPINNQAPQQPQPQPQPMPQPQPLPSDPIQPQPTAPRTSTQLQCGKRIYLFGPPTYGTYMQCCGEDVFDVRSDTCIGTTKITGGAQTGKK